jgi:hypothetical protein
MFGYRVPAPDQAMLISGGKSSGTPFRVVTGHGAYVMPFIRKVRFLTLAMCEAEVEETCVTQQGISLNVRAVIAFKVGNDAESIVNAGQRFLCDQSQMSVLTGRIFGGPQRSHPTRRPDHSSTSESGRRRRTARIPAEPGESDSPQRVGRRTISCVIGTGAASALRDRCGAKRLGRAGLSAVRCIGDCELHLAGVVGRGVEGPVVEHGRCLLVEEDAGAVLFEHLIAGGGRRHQGEREGVRRRVIGDAHAAALGQFRVRGEVADLSGGVIGQREHRRTSLRPFVSDADARRFPSRIPDAVAVG